MLTHKRIRERQAECRAMYAAKSITTAQFVDSMNELNVELKNVEEKMYAAAEDVSGQINLLRFIDGTVPAAFKKIHARFPHLTFDEVVAFEQTVRAAGGKIMTHSGIFVPTKRPSGFCGGSDIEYDFYVSWTCCHSVAYNQYERRYETIGTNNSPISGIYFSKFVYLKNVQYVDKVSACDVAKPLPSPDLKNPDPLSSCDEPSLFSLTDEIVPGHNSENTIAEMKLATQKQIDKIENEISDLRRKAGHYDDLLKSLSALSDA